VHWDIVRELPRRLARAERDEYTDADRQQLPELQPEADTAARVRIPYAPFEGRSAGSKALWLIAVSDSRRLAGTERREEADDDT
jgi:hypothetical protein